MIIPEAYSADEAGASDAEEELPSLDPSLSTLLSSFADSPAVESVFAASAAGAAASVASLFSGCWAQAIAPPAISSKAAIVTIVFFIAFKIKRFLFTSSVRICLINRSDKMEFKRRAIRIKNGKPLIDSGRQGTTESSGVWKGVESRYKVWK